MPDTEPEPVETLPQTSKDDVDFSEGVVGRIIDESDLENIDELIFETARSLARKRLTRGSEKVTFRGDESQESQVRASVTKQYIKTIQTGVKFGGDAGDVQTNRKFDPETHGLFDKWDIATHRTHDRDANAWGTLKNKGIKSKLKTEHRSPAASGGAHGDDDGNRQITDVYAESCKERGCVPNTRAS